MDCYIDSVFIFIFACFGYKAAYDFTNTCFYFALLMVISGFLTLVSLVPLAGEYSCKRRTEVLNLETSWDFWIGCSIKQNGQLVPYEKFIYMKEVK